MLKTKKNTLNILVIDDDQIDRESVNRFIKKTELPYNLTFAESLTQALSLLSENSGFDVMLIDYILGDGNGLEILEKYASKVPGIFLTGNGDEQLAVEALNKGAYDYLVKDNDRNYLQILELTINKVIKRKEVELDAAETKIALENSNRDLEQFAYIVSHDLNEPLRTVKSFCELLERRYGDKFDDDGQEFVGYITDGCSRMQVLINDLLLYSRACSKELVFEEAESSEVLKDVLLNLQVKIQENKVDIVLPDYLPRLYIHKSYIEQVFQNIISNAIKFCEKQPQITISCKDIANDMVEFTISDNGIGIQKDHFERIFMVFQRLHTREEYEGSGIGLSMCKKAIERHGGYIYPESVYGEGTSFRFSLPKFV